MSQAPAPTPHGTAVVSYRGEIVEDRHQLSVAVVDPAGRLLRHCGDPARPTLLRSTAKPFQVQPLLRATTPRASELALDDEELALACASHTGEPRQVAIAGRLLERLGLTESALGCGAHAPVEAAHQALIRTGREPSALHNNCSGKHAAMLASALAHGWPIEGYLEPEHPLQAAIRGVLTDLSGTTHLPLAIDGCSAPTYALPLAALARMFAALLEPDAAPERLRAGLARTQAAMRRYPELVGGEGVIDTLLMRSIPGLVAKRGAAAAYALAVRSPRLGPVGVALKVEDGSSEARECAIVRVLELLGVAVEPFPELAAFREPVRRNCRGLGVGRIVAKFELEAA